MTRNLAAIRLKWRLGRKLYMNARGEQRYGDIARNGEAFAQRCVVEKTSEAVPLVVFDIGANQGEWTESLLQALPAARREQDHLVVHAFEPVPSTAAMFRERLAKYPEVKTVELHECAMSEATGQAEIMIYGAGAGTNSLHFSREEQKTETTLEVPLKPLDLVRGELGIDHIHFVKCDTEGHDAKVIKGAADSLSAGCIDVLQFEYNHRWVSGGAFLKDIFDMIIGLPYNLARVDETGLTVFKTWHPELERFFQSNYMLVHDRALSWFPLHHGHFDKANTYA